MFNLFQNLKSKSTLSDLSPKRSYSKKELDTLALLLKNNSVRQSAFESAYEEVEKDLDSFNLSQQNAQKQIEKSDKLVELTSETEVVVEKIVDELGLEYTYYKWVKVGDDFELTLYKDKPKEEYTRYLLQVFTFVLGYALICPLAFIFSCGVFYGLFDFLRENLPESNNPMLPWLSFIFYLFLSFLLSVVISFGSLDLYVVWFREIAWGKKLESTLYFGTLGSINKPRVTSN